MGVGLRQTHQIFQVRQIIQLGCVRGKSRSERLRRANEHASVPKKALLEIRRRLSGSRLFDECAGLRVHIAELRRWISRTNADGDNGLCASGLGQCYANRPAKLFGVRR